MYTCICTYTFTNTHVDSNTDTNINVITYIHTNGLSCMLTQSSKNCRNSKDLSQLNPKTTKKNPDSSPTIKQYVNAWN